MNADPPPAPRLKLAVTTAISHGGLDHFLPGRKMKWGNCDILLNPPPGTSCDFWIVYASSRNKDHLQVAPENTLFIAGEPPSKKIYPSAYYAQFHRVVSCHAEDPHPRVTTSALGLTWHVGLDHRTDHYLLGYDELVTLTPPAERREMISVVCSNLTTTQGQRDRLAFLDQLKHEIPDRIVHFGRGFQTIDDKLDAILPHRYHLVLENSYTPDYWTEKLADAYLGHAYPIYAGCPNLKEYFPADGFTPIDISRPEESIAIIRQLLEQGVDMVPIAECRRRILDIYNPFARFAYWAEKFYEQRAQPKTITITSHRAYRPFPRGLLHRIKSKPPST